MVQPFQEIPLWPTDAVPFAEADDVPKHEYFQPETGDGINRLTDVTIPSVTFFPVSGKAPHPAVLVCPGGGYTILAWNHEGRDICAWFNSIGFSAFLLKYRCPGRRAAAHADAARAMRLIRANAEAFGIDSTRLGILGFSAGAHLSATVSAPAEAEPYPAADAVDRQSYRPDFTALIYPAYLVDDQWNLAPEFAISASVPPTFLLQSEDDGIHVENSLTWFLALKRAGVKAELHVYPSGGHGYGILRTGNPISEWPTFAAAWFRRQAGLN